jgi:serine/threonine-protein kinase
MSEPFESTVASQPADTASDGDEAYCAACNQSFGLDHMFCPNDGARLVKLKARPDLLLGRVFDTRYEIRALLGHGGMGTVYRGWQLSVDREVAIKVIHPKLASVRDVAKRFLREARLSSRLNQPNIINVYDFGQTDDGILYLVMELLRGRPLARDLEMHRPMPVRRITTIALQICDGLEAAHGQGIIHRDLKPQNIVILDDPPGRDLVKILDFGLAKSLLNDTTSLVTQSDALLGTPLYMPPEQILGKPSDRRADLYSLGCILYQMVSGRPPFVGENINVVLGAHIREPAPPLPDDAPPSLVAMIHRLMRKAPEDRLATAGVVHELMAALAAGSQAAVPELATRAEPAKPPPGPAAPAVTPTTGGGAGVRPRRWLPVIVALLAVAAISGAAVGVVVSLSSRRATAPASGGADARAVGGAGDRDAGDRAPAAVSGLVDAGGGDGPGARDPRVPVDARAPVDARVPGGGRSPAEPLHARRLDAGAAASGVDAAAPRPVDAGMPDLDLLPTRRGADR